MLKFIYMCVMLSVQISLSVLWKLHLSHGGDTAYYLQLLGFKDKKKSGELAC